LFIEKENNKKQENNRAAFSKIKRQAFLFWMRTKLCFSIRSALNFMRASQTNFKTFFAVICSKFSETQSFLKVLARKEIIT
jgi:hypothetical protein